MSESECTREAGDGRRMNVMLNGESSGINCLLLWIKRIDAEMKSIINEIKTCGDD